MSASSGNIQRQQFRRLPGFPLHIVSWGTEHAVYHEGSGNTHLLDEFGFAVLQSLQSDNADFDTVVERSADYLNIIIDDEFRAHMREVVRQLAKHDLIEIAPDADE